MDCIERVKQAVDGKGGDQNLNMIINCAYELGKYVENKSNCEKYADLLNIANEKTLKSRYPHMIKGILPSYDAISRYPADYMEYYSNQYWENSGKRQNYWNKPRD